MKAPKRRRAFTIYEFSLTSSGDRTFVHSEAPQAKPYKVHDIRFVVFGRKETAEVEIQGKMLVTDSAAIQKVCSELKSIGVKRCESENLVWTHLRREKPYAQDWRYGCDFCLRMNSLLLAAGRKISMDQAVWQVYEDLAEELNFLNVRPFLEIYHHVLHLIDHHWVAESEQFVKAFYRPPK